MFDNILYDLAFVYNSYTIITVIVIIIVITLIASYFKKHIQLQIRGNQQT